MGEASTVSAVAWVGGNEWRQRRDQRPAGSTRGARRESAARAPTSGVRASWPRIVGIYGLALVIVLADWLTPAGVVVGILLGIPILFSSAGNDRREVIAVSIACTIGFVVAAVFGRGPVSPEAVWLPNRVFAIIAIAASSVVSLVLQRRRIAAEAARKEAESARDLSRLLHSLMAHDLRAPLALARQALSAVEQPLRSGLPVDLELMTDVDARLRRSLRTIQLVLDSARAELATHGNSGADPPVIDLASEIRHEAASFGGEAQRRSKEIQLDLPARELPVRLDPSVLRQSVAILVDNAIRYAVPGRITISALLAERHVVVSVRDSGPGLSRRRAQEAQQSGEGLGLKLCELLAERAGGRLEVVRDDENGTEFVLRLPVAS